MNQSKTSQTSETEPEPRALPLKGVKVLDLSRVLAGPWATMSLADLGAEVWKIENINGGDDTRAWATPNFKGVSTYYLCANRGKESLAVDLKHPEGREIILKLAAEADIFVENFRGGTVDRLGIGYDDFRKINPRLIYCSISGYGQTGPQSDRPGYDFIMQAESGLMSITGEVDGPPLRVGVAITDIVAGMVATQSILAALLEVRTTGKGQFIDIALLDCALNLLVNVGTGYLNANAIPTRFGNAHPTVVPYQLFQASDGDFALAVGNDRQFACLCDKVVNLPDLATDDRFMTAKNRAVYTEELIIFLSAEFLKRSCDYWLQSCMQAGVPAAVVKDVPEALESPVVIERNVIHTLEHPFLDQVRLVRPAHGLEAQQSANYKAPPMLGQDSEAVLGRVLKYDDLQIRELINSGAIAQYEPVEKET
ncbi:MAG: CoA transferase [Rhizobiaceae bacterium]|nr:CoA transferase [Rhizobiaceae bacterium]